MSTQPVNILLYCPSCGETSGDHPEECPWVFRNGRWILPDERPSEFVRYSDSGCTNDMRFGANDD